MPTYRTQGKRSLNFLSATQLELPICTGPHEPGRRLAKLGERSREGPAVETLHGLTAEEERLLLARAAGQDQRAELEEVRVPAILLGVEYGRPVIPVPRHPEADALVRVGGHRLHSRAERVHPAEAAGVETASPGLDQPLGPPRRLVYGHDGVGLEGRVGGVDQPVAEVEGLAQPVLLVAPDEPVEVSEVCGQNADARLVVVVTREDPVVLPGGIPGHVVDVHDAAALEHPADLEASPAVFRDVEPHRSAVTGLRVVLAEEHALVRSHRDRERRHQGLPGLVHVACLDPALAGLRVEHPVAVRRDQRAVRERRQCAHFEAQQPRSEPHEATGLALPAHGERGPVGPRRAVVLGLVDRVPAGRVEPAVQPHGESAARAKVLNLKAFHRFESREKC